MPTDLPAPQTPRLREGTARSYPSLRAIGALMLREIYTSNGRTPGGFIWSILDPVAGLMIMTVAFALVFRDPPLGHSFALFYATGILPYTMFRGISMKVASSVTYSRQLLVYPAITFLDPIIARFLVNLFVELVAAYLILGVIFTLIEMPASIDVPLLMQGFALTAVLGFGFGVMLAYPFTRSPLWQTMWGLITRPLMIFSCVLFTFESVPDKFRWLFWYNPVTHTVGMVRDSIYPTYNAQYTLPIYPAALSLVTCALGILLLRRYYREALDT